MDFYWQRAPVAGRLVTIVVAAAPEGTHPWYAPYTGTARAAVELTLPTGKFVYLDNQDGSGLAAATTPPGAAIPAHRAMNCARVIAEEAPPPAVPPDIGQLFPQPTPTDPSTVSPSAMNAMLRAHQSIPGGVGPAVTADMATNAAKERLAAVEAENERLRAQLAAMGDVEAQVEKPAGKSKAAAAA